MGPLLRDQLAVPAQNGVGRHDGRDFHQGLTAQRLSLHGQQATLIINHYGLNLADPRANEFLMEQMENFLFGGDGQQVDMNPATAAGASKK